MLAGFGLFDGIKAAYSFLGARFVLLATLNMASQMLCLKIILLSLIIHVIPLSPMHSDLPKQEGHVPS